MNRILVKVLVLACLPVGWSSVGRAAGEPSRRARPAVGSVLVVVLESVNRDTLRAQMVRLVGDEPGDGRKTVGPNWTRIGELPPGDHRLEIGNLFFNNGTAVAHVRSGAEDTVTVVLSPWQSVTPGHRYIAVPAAPLPARPEDDRRYPPDGFSFLLSDANGNRIDSPAGRVTKDLVVGPDTSTFLALTPVELDRIRRRMIAIRFFDMDSPHPEDWPGGGGTVLMHLEATAGGVTKRLDWTAGFTEDSYPSDDWKRVRDLVEFIREIVEARPEYKALPRARGAYL